MTVDAPGVRFYMNAMEVVVVTFFPNGMPAQMERVGIERFISECKRIRAAMP